MLPRYWFICLVVMMVGCSENRHSHLGVNGGRLAACPDSLNCVSSQSADPGHTIDPLHYTETTEKARAALTEVLSGMKRVRIVLSGEQYLRAEFTSAFFRFVDDVEFSLMKGPGQFTCVRRPAWDIQISG
jgi:uncharacterized protein (DUF1499 family)